MAGPLEDVTVLDLSRDTPGSYACMLLGDMGATVLKIEPVHGHLGRSSPAFYLWNRGRKSVALDYQRPEGRKVLERLIKDADVLVETFLSREVEEHRLGYEALEEINPRLIYCALPPFGDTGPLADKPADDGVINAYAGVYGNQGGLDAPPVFVHLPIASYGTAMMAAYAVSVALFARELTGQGQKVEVPWYSGAMAMQSHLVVKGPQISLTQRRQRNQLGVNPVYRLYRCKDDWMFLACGNNTFWNKLCIALGMEALTEDPRFLDAPWGIPPEYQGFLSSLLEDIFRENSRAYWLDLLTSYGITVAPVETRSQFVDHPQVGHNHMMVKMDDPVVGQTQQMGISIAMYRTPSKFSGPAPYPGQHTREVLSSLGYTLKEVQAMVSSGTIGVEVKTDAKARL